MKTRFISPLTWPGGKAKQWKLIKSYFPKNTKGMWYIEPFFAGGSVGLNALREKIFEEYRFNDIDQELIQFWNEMISMNTKNLKELFYPNANLEELKNNFHSCSKGLKFLLENNLTFNGQRWGTWTQKRLEQNWNLNKFTRITECNKLLLNNKNIIRFYNDDFNDLVGCMQRHCFWYLDPPYFGNNGKPYRYKFKDSDWKRFINFLHRNEFKNKSDLFLFSIDDCLETRKMFKDYFIHEVEWKYTSSNTNGNKQCRLGKELIITNYEVDYEN